MIAHRGRLIIAAAVAAACAGSSVARADAVALAPSFAGGVGLTAYGDHIVWSRLDAARA